MTARFDDARGAPLHQIISPSVTTPIRVERPIGVMFAQCGGGEAVRFTLPLSGGRASGTDIDVVHVYVRVFLHSDVFLVPPSISTHLTSLRPVARQLPASRASSSPFRRLSLFGPPAQPPKTTPHQLIRNKRARRLFPSAALRIHASRLLICSNHLGTAHNIRAGTRRSRFAHVHSASRRGYLHPQQAISRFQTQHHCNLASWTN